MELRLKETGRYPARVELISLLPINPYGKQPGWHAKIGVRFDTGAQNGHEKWPAAGQAVVETEVRQTLAEVIADINAAVEQIEK